MIRDSSNKAAVSKPSQQEVDRFVYAIRDGVEIANRAADQDAIDAANAGLKKTVLDFLGKHGQESLDEWSSDASSMTALMHAATCTYPQTTALLLERGASPDIQTIARWSALMFAAFFEHQDACALLLEHGANVTLQNAQGETALMLGLHMDNRDIITLMLENGADINTRNSAGESAVDWAQQYGSDELVALLRQAPELQKKAQEKKKAVKDLAASNPPSGVLFKTRLAQLKSHQKQIRIIKP